MNKQLRTLLAAILLMGMTVACQQNDLEELNIQDMEALDLQLTEGNTNPAGNPSGGADKDDDDDEL